ncbi:MAG: hypothetical protein ACLSG9_06175 [Eubacterium sp.]
MKKRIFSVLAIMCSMMLILTGCGEANETDVSDELGLMQKITQ